MPMGMSRLGFFASCAAVDTASKPMNAKKTMPAAVTMPPKPPNACVTPASSLYSVGAGMYGLWFAAFMKPQPSTMMRTTIVTFVTTMSVLTNADSRMPRMSRSVSRSRMPTAGRLMMPCVPVAASVWKGEWQSAYGMPVPKRPSSLLRYSLHAMATVAAPMAYSSTRSQPMIHATSSPIVAYEYVYALPAMGIIDDSSA